jgi:hypothetical protein
MPDTADRPLRFAAQAGHAAYTGNLDPLSTRCLHRATEYQQRPDAPDRASFAA